MRISEVSLYIIYVTHKSSHLCRSGRHSSALHWDRGEESQCSSGTAEECIPTAKCRKVSLAEKVESLHMGRCTREGCITT